MVENLRLVFLSFLASVCFGVVFRIRGKDLFLAGLGGALTRIVYLLLLQFIPNRLIYSMLAALFAALYAELLATIRKDPSTYFVYPSIVPLIPGDLFYYSMAGLFFGDAEMLRENGINCLLTLLGMSIGFVVSSIVAHYLRRAKHRKKITKSHLGGSTT